MSKILSLIAHLVRFFLSLIYEVIVKMLLCAESMDILYLNIKDEAKGLIKYSTYGM